MTQFNAKVLRTLYHLIPHHMKRVVLWASVLSAYRKSNEVDNACVKALNNLLGLCKKDSAMALPISISKVIWEDMNGAVQVLHDADIQSPFNQKAQLRERFIKAIPSWLRYGSDSNMGDDFDKLVQNRNIVGI